MGPSSQPGQEVVEEAVGQKSKEDWEKQEQEIEKKRLLFRIKQLSQSAETPMKQSSIVLLWEMVEINYRIGIALQTACFPLQPLLRLEMGITEKEKFPHLSPAHLTEI